MKYIITSILLLFAVFSHAQVAVTKNTVLYIIKSRTGKPDIKTERIVIDGDRIEKLEVVDAQKLNNRFGDIKQNLVVFATLKSDVNLITLVDFFLHQKIDYKSMPTSIDGQAVKKYNDVYIDEKSIQEVTVGLDSIRINTSTYYNQLQQKASKSKD